MNVLHLISSLEVGGAERALERLVRDDTTGRNSTVVSLTSVGVIGERLKSDGIRVEALGMSRRFPSPVVVLRLRRFLRETSPSIFQTWMYHADLLGPIARGRGDPPIVWNVRHSHLDPAGTRSRTRWVAKACARLSYRVPARIVCGSYAAAREHTVLGYDASKMVVIPNGFDTELFVPSPQARREFRAEIDVSGDVPVFGIVGRLDPQKDHETFLQGAAVAARCSDAHFALVGRGVDESNEKLRATARSLGIEDRCHFMGQRADVPRVMAGLDVLVSSSTTEGFSNVVGEAMSAGVPCVVTDVGDSAEIVDATGFVVPARDHEALGAAMNSFIVMGSDERLAMGRAARERVTKHYLLADCLRRYNELYREVAGT